MEGALNLSSDRLLDDDDDDDDDDSNDCIMQAKNFKCSTFLSG